MTAESKKKVFYLYGISQGAGGKLRAIGVDAGEAVEAIPANGLSYWVSRVDSSEYGDNLASNMENLDWLANAGVRHQKTVSAIAAQCTILPARFGTVFRSETSLRKHVEENRLRFEKILKRIDGADEWGIKIFRIPQHAKREPVSSGAEYLRQKAAALGRDAKKEVDPEVERFSEELSRIASASASVGKVSGGQANLEWQASFLLPRHKRKQWDALLKRYATQWLETRTIESTGPWPPYSFVS